MYNLWYCNNRDIVVIELYTFKVAWFSPLYHLSVQRLENPETSVVYHGAPLCIYICDTLPLDNPKTHPHLALSHITVDFNGLKTYFRQQYLRLGNTIELLSCAWRSFHFICIKWVAVL